MADAGIESATVSVTALDISYGLTLTFPAGTVVSESAMDIIGAALLEALAEYGVSEAQIQVALAVRLCIMRL